MTYFFLTGIEVLFGIEYTTKENGGFLMQYLKYEVRKNIVEESLKEFKQLGYKGTSIRNIAKNSQTSVGNFYKYFQSKDDLYEKLIGPVYDKLMDYINQFNKVEINEKADEIFYELMEKIMEIFKVSSIELTILLNKSEGSKYENCKKSFVDFITRIVTEKMKYELLQGGKKLNNNFIIYLLSYNLVESISIILREKEDGEEVRKLILVIIDIFYSDIIGKLDCENID
ncbi:MAG: TetR/AcrR family transcriptional regulator [Clostridium sp.]|uniref:TetR/AcrR family transcriptional regulator n=1 Tax=Clostridium sp. TaxID=1506 RepID=UPI003D6CDEE8